MTKESAGLLVYRKTARGLEFLLVHPGGPFWKNKDAGAWSIPKGEPNAGEEDLLLVARREFEEEIGTQVDGEFMKHPHIKQKSAKVVHACAVVGEIDT